MNEPSVFSAWGDPTLPLETCHQLDGQSGDHLLAHNLYGLLMDRAGAEGICRLQPDRRPWILSRSGWAGLQRFAWNWTGDIETSWAGFRQTIATILGLGLSGIPYSGSDIGGFGGNPDAELYTRWFQAAAFMPFFRTHSAFGTERREPWVYGEEITGILRKFLKLRYRLMPYLYTLAWQAAQTGWPLVRPLFWLDENDPDLLEDDDSFLLGNDLLVAPVLEEGARSRSVRLPAGEWYDFWEETQESWKGPTVIEVPVNLQRIPVLARGGSLIPMEEEHHLELHLYPKQSDESQAQLYSDAGDRYGLSRLDRFEMKWSPDQVTIDWQSDGDYPFPYVGVSVSLHGRKIEQAQVDREARTIFGNRIETGQFRKLEVPLQ
jgi:alpha-glucosidase